MRERGDLAVRERREHVEIDADVFDDGFDAEALLASIEASLDDAEPWRRLGEVLGRITGELEPD